MLLLLLLLLLPKLVLPCLHNVVRVTSSSVVWCRTWACCRVVIRIGSCGGKPRCWIQLGHRCAQGHLAVIEPKKWKWTQIGIYVSWCNEPCKLYAWLSFTSKLLWQVLWVLLISTNSAVAQMCTVCYRFLCQYHSFSEMSMSFKAWFPTEGKTPKTMYTQNPYCSGTVCILILTCSKASSHSKHQRMHIWHIKM